MAAWLKPLLLALLAALCLHVLGLIGIGSQMQVVPSVLNAQSDPMFTRTIEAASAPNLPVAPKATTETPSPRAATQIIADPENTLVQPTVTIAAATVTTTADALTTTSTTSIPPEAKDKIADLLLTPARPDLNAATVASTSSSASSITSVSSQSTGGTDTLLATGEWPADTRVTYVMTGFYNGELHGKGQVQWTRTGLAADRYQVRVAVDAGLMEMRITSQGRVSAQGLLPEVFEEYVKVIGRDARVRPLKLEGSDLVLADGHRIPRPAREPLAVQDSVSQFIDIGHRFQQGRDKLETGQAITVWLGRPGGLDEWIYDVGEPETVRLPRIGEVQVFPLRPRPVVNARGTITMSMWLAPSLQYLPAKIRINVNAETYIELLAERLEQR